MKRFAIEKLISLLLSMVTPDMLKDVADMILDLIEDRYADNMAVISICTAIRAQFDIEDDD